MMGGGRGFTGLFWTSNLVDHELMQPSSLLQKAYYLQLWSFTRSLGYTVSIASRRIQAVQAEKIFHQAAFPSMAGETPGNNPYISRMVSPLSQCNIPGYTQNKCLVREPQLLLSHTLQAQAWFSAHYFVSNFFIPKLLLKQEL